MAYLLQGSEFPILFYANHCVHAVPTGLALLEIGAEVLGGPTNLPANTKIVQTIRNHFDVLVDAWMLERQQHDFADYVERVLGGEHLYLQADSFYNKFGPWDYILRYETLQFDLDILCLTAGLPEVVLDPEPQQTQSLQLFSKRLYQKVLDRYSDELTRMGYK